MAQKNVYNEIEDAEKVDAKIKSDEQADKKSASPNEAGQGETDSDSEVPAAHDAAGVSVKEDAKTKAKKFTYKNLEGDLVLIPTKKCFQIFAGMTVHIQGIGKWLSGFYYVTSRKVTISGGGAMTINLKVERTKFGDSLKGEPPVEIEEEDLIGDNDKTTSSAGLGGYSDVGGGSVDVGGGDIIPSDYQDGTDNTGQQASISPPSKRTSARI